MLRLSLYNLDTEQITQVRRMPRSLLDVDEGEYLKRDLSARELWTRVLVSSLLRN